MIKRRRFLASVAALPVIAEWSSAQEGPPVPEEVERYTAPPRPTIALNHLGFRPRLGSKVLLVRDLVTPAPAEFTVRDVVDRTSITRLLRRVIGALGPMLVGDFTNFERPGMYQIQVGEELSVPFFIRDDVWRRTLPKAVGYYRYQRCGVDVPGVHPACHLDDARRRDNGVHVDVVGGWHDAGDVRKWMDVTMLNAIALLNLARNNPHPRAEDPTFEQLLEEVRYGNSYFLKMQDTDGKVWADTAGGVNGDNSDNHWTDNIIGTADDRYINTSKHEIVSAVFATLEALAAQSYRDADPPYAHQCLQAAVRAWSAWGNPTNRQTSTASLSWWILAACELLRATGDASYASAAANLADLLLRNQITTYIAGQSAIRGFWMHGPAARSATLSPPQQQPYLNIVFSAAPALALLEAHNTLISAPTRQHWRQAVQLYIDEYVLPMTARSSFGILPVGVFIGSPTPETYRPLMGNLTYRYFMPVRKQFWWQGANCHLAQHALLLARYAQLLPTERRYIDLAYRQLEWIMGANPFAACMMTAEGMRNPYPHSRFVGLIPGGIMNGIAGNAADEPILDQHYGMDWRTCEYWSPHVAYYIWANSILEQL